MPIANLLKHGFRKVSLGSLRGWTRKTNGVPSTRLPLGTHMARGCRRLVESKRRRTAAFIPRYCHHAGVLWADPFIATGAAFLRVWTLSIAVILVACDPILLVQSTQVMTETLATFLAMATLIAWAFAMRATRDPSPAHTLLVRTIVSGLFVGMTLAAGYLVRPVSIVWTALLSAYVALWLVQSLLARKNLQASSAPAIRFTMINWTCACLVVLTTVGLWTMRNQRSLGQPIWATTHGGYTLLLANNPPLYNHLRSPGWPTFWEPDLFFAGWAAREAGDLTNESFWQSPPVPMPITADELTDDRVAGQAAKATIARDPAMFTYSCLVRLYCSGHPRRNKPHATTHRCNRLVLVGLWLGGLQHTETSRIVVSSPVDSWLDAGRGAVGNPRGVLE